MNCWLFVISNYEWWLECRKRGVCAASFKGRKTDDVSKKPGWKMFVDRASAIEPGDLVVSYLRKNRVGAVGKVLEKYYIDGWEPLITGKNGADYARLLKVEWDKTSLPPEGKSALIPKNLRKGGEHLATLNKITKDRLEQFRQILANSENWVDASVKKDTGSRQEVEPGTGEIFISYKREDQATARTLANALEAKGWSVWWDPKLRAGERYFDVIEEALKGSKAVVVLWSKRSVESDDVKEEATYALELKKIVPVMIEQVELPLGFKALHTLSLFDWDGSQETPGFRSLVDDISATGNRNKNK